MIDIKIKKSLHTSDGNLILDLDLVIEENRITAISGKSGSGKTTFLRILSGLMTPDEGTIRVSGKTLFDSEQKINIPSHKRKIGFVFQDYALFPNMSVKKNLVYANKNPGIADELLELMELNNLKDRMPDNLSAGQKQRVALARAIAGQPDILLLDEPLSALDDKMRMKLREEIILIRNKFKMTIILVSHDVPEFFKLSDRVIIIDKGVVLRDGKPADIYINQKTSHKFSFTGKLIRLLKADIIYIAFVSIGNDICEIVITEDEAGKLKIGDKILVASKAFNPVIKKID